MAKIPRDVWDECRAAAERKARTLTYEDLSMLLLELALENESDQHLNALKPVRTPWAILGSLGVCIYVPASRHWLISFFPIHLT